MTHHIYLSGPITGTSHDVARLGWRKEVIDAFADDPNIECLSPMRYKGHLEKVQHLSRHGEPGSVVSCPRGLTTRDRFDTMKSDIMLANLEGADRISVGTMIEFGWADACRVPIVCVLDDLHDHAMVQELIGFKCCSLQEAIAVCRAILTPDV